MAALLKPVALRGASLVVAFSLLLAGRAHAAAEKDFTPWMSISEMNAYVEGLDGDKPEGKNFWSRGNWITGVEGRWEAGIPQYRISHSPVPAARAHWWFWFLNVDPKAFEEKVNQLADDGYTLVHYNGYVRPGGGERFQGVWHKLVPLSAEPPLPAGNYWLTELHGKPLSGPPLAMTIEGTAISGHGPAGTYTGSVKGRFSGAITAASGARDGGSDPFKANAQRTLLEALEYATWKEEGGRLRAIKNGKTVLRFERDRVELEAPANP
ncbi:MAG TPA: hypothetical protein VF614_11920 [Chthoniobacteraceae bacterium]|jgi:hypothetical protein